MCSSTCEVARVHAVDDVSIQRARGRDARARPGESGCTAASTLGQGASLRLLEPTSGEIEFDGVAIAKLKARKLRPLRREMQMVFQDPYASLNPRKRVGSIIGYPLRIHGIDDRQEATARSAMQELAP